MKRTVPFIVILLTLGVRPGVTQKMPKEQAALNSQQLLGRQVLIQSCAICHLPSAPDAKTFGPSLNKSTLRDEDDAIRETILEGNSRMPGFKYSLQPKQIDAIIAYLRTIPTPARSAAPAQQKSNMED